MKFNVATVLALLPLLAAALSQVEDIKDAADAAARKAAIKAFTETVVKAAETGTGKDLVNDPDVLDAVGKVFDAVVALDKVVKAVVVK